jgi:nicotinate-nucleotide adenylyltransferase
VNIALFGGTFDPIHAGHVQAARAAIREFSLDRVLFIPTGTPPHKDHDGLTPFPQRYGMVVLACAGDRQLIPSLLEAPKPEGKPHYSIDTVRKARRALRRGDHLFFLIGIDAFLDLPCWKDYRRLLGLVDFIVVSRPSFDATEIRKVAPAAMTAPCGAAGKPDTIRMRRSALHVLQGVDMPVASHQIRKMIALGQPVTGLVPPLVEEYILKEGLYRPRRLTSL